MANGDATLESNNRRNGHNQGRYWLLTIPEGDYVPSGDLPEGVCFIKGQLEEGAFGYRHFQVVACFDRRVRTKTVRERFGGRAWCELTRSVAAMEYVWKEQSRIGEPFEYGELPINRNSSTDWERIWQYAKEGTIEKIPAQIRITSYRTLRTIRADYAKPEAMERICNVYCGPTGTGKSRKAWTEAGLDAYPKDPRSKFWDGYRDQRHVVIDEFRGDIAMSHILRWLDRYPCLVEIKGSSTSLVATTIWITSNLHPSKWYPDCDQETVNALFRRLNIVEF